MTDGNEYAREMLFGQNDPSRMVLSSESENAVESLINRTKATSHVNMETEDRLRKGISMFAGMLEYNGVPVSRALNGVKIAVGSPNVSTSYSPNDGVVYLDSDFTPEDVPHELKHYFDNSVYGLPGTNTLREQYYDGKTQKIDGSFFDSSNRIINKTRGYTKLDRPGIDPYMSIATGFGFPSELEPQVISHLLYGHNSTNPNAKMLRDMLLSTKYGQQPLPRDIVDQLKQALCAAGTLFTSKTDTPSEPQIPPDSKEMLLITRQTMDAMQKAAYQMEVLRNRIALYKNLASAHLKRLQNPKADDTASIQKNYDDLELEHPEAFDNGDVDGLRQVLKNPVDRTPNNSIIDLLKLAGYPNPRTVLQPEFD